MAKQNDDEPGSGEPGKVSVHGVMKSAAAGEKVTIACKVPMGVVLQLYRMVDRDEPAPGGFRTVKVAQPIAGARIEVAGPGYPVNMSAYAPIIAAREPGPGEGYALTPGVDADFWNAWCEQNAGSPLLESRMLFAEIKQVFLEGRAKEQIALRSGLEPLHRASDGNLDDLRQPTPINPLIGKVSTAVRAAA